VLLLVGITSLSFIGFAHGYLIKNQNRVFKFLIMHILFLYIDRKLENPMDGKPLWIAAEEQNGSVYLIYFRIRGSLSHNLAR
jgi:hypothetical protein